MPKSDGQGKADRLYLLCQLFDQKGRRLRTGEIAEKLGVDDDTVRYYISELSASGRLPLRKDGQFWIQAEDTYIEQLKVHLTISEATALYVAARLLSQIHDERNSHVILALYKLSAAMPEPLRAHQRVLVEMAEQRQKDQEDRSGVFHALTMGWATQRKVHLVYDPPRKRRFESLFCPYLLEPSGIGRTVYAIGYSEPPNALRTFKLERIQHATLTNEAFAVPDDFDGPRRLATAWGVMYSDEEPVKVRLRFSHTVKKRVQETLWHPSQTITMTPEGCEWTAIVAETLEIENWIRGWGSDCEVLAPISLREKAIAHIREAARIYSIAFKEPAAPTEPDEDLFNSFFGE